MDEQFTVPSAKVVAYKSALEPPLICLTSVFNFIRNSENSCFVISFCVICPFQEI